MRVPNHPTEIDSSWLSGALGVSVTGCHAGALSGEVAMTADVRRFHLDGDGPSSVVVKLSTRPDTASMAEREVRTYRELTGRLPAPHCYYAAFASGRGVLVLEDLTNRAPGFPRTGMTATQARSLLAAARAWHSLAADGWPHKVLPDGIAHQERIRSGWARLDRVQFPAAPAVVDAIERHIDTLPEDLARLDASPRGLTHNDLHAGNLWFDGPRPIVFDWQNTASGPVARDLASIVTSTRPSDLPALWSEVCTHADPAVLRGALGYALGAIAWLADHAASTERDPAVMRGHWDRLSAALECAATR